jgi:hypothetical protein
MADVIEIELVPFRLAFYETANVCGWLIKSLAHISNGKTQPAQLRRLDHAGGGAERLGGVDSVAGGLRRQVQIGVRALPVQITSLPGPVSWVRKNLL